MLRSSAWSDTRRNEWVRAYKRYHQIKDAVFDPDEPNVALSYVFGLIEQIATKVTEPVLRMKPPCPVIPSRLGDMQPAKNFEQIARSWYSQPTMQGPFARSKKEMVICGPRFEIDEWVDIRRDGKMWGQVQQVTEVQAKDIKGKPLVDKDGKPVMAKDVRMVPGEVDIKVQLHHGFHTRYPCIFDCYPEPDRPTIGTGLKTDCSWFFEDMGEMAIEEMAREMVVDPHDNVAKPKYDFGRLLHDHGQNAEKRYKAIMDGKDPARDNLGPLIVPERNWSYSSDYGREEMDTMYPTEGTVDRQSSEDRDKIWVGRGYEAGCLVTIANGKYVIHRKEAPWHVPLMPIRVDGLTMDPRYIYSKGVITPIEDELDIRNDIVNMSLSQLIRIINKLQYIAEGEIVTMSDFKPKAGGKVRLKGNMPARDAVVDIPQESATSEMLTLDSYIKGNIEFASSNMDGSAGVMGTKQGHKTSSGLEMIQAALTGRFETVQRQAIGNEAARMGSMQRFFNQHAFEPMDYQFVNDDGGTTFARLSKDDIYTQGRPFLFRVEIDLNFGNTRQQRQDDLDLFEISMKFEEARRAMKDPNIRKVDLSQLFEKVLQDFGWRDTSGIFIKEGHMVDPDTELMMIMQGSTDVECTGDLQAHAIAHMNQAKSPGVLQQVQNKKAHPETIQRLEMLSKQCMAKLATFLQNPQYSAQKKKNQILKTQGAQEE
jgi:hypothetical protein